MHQQQQPPPQRGALPPTQAFVGAGMPPPPPQGAGDLASMAAARARAAEQMALEDAWKALNPDFRTPFTSVEDAVSRCVRARSSPPIFLAAADRPASSWRRYHARLARRAGSLSCSTRDLVFHFRLLRGSSCLHLPWDMFVKGFGD